MDFNSPETWRWIWAVMAIVFLLGELTAPATFFFLPFAIGATAAAVSSILLAPVGLSWTVFLVISVIAFGGLWRLGRRLERTDEQQEGVGATRWIGQEARVVEEIGEGGFGAVRLEREEWRAESLTGGRIRAGSTVMVARVAGTRLVVVPVDEPPDLPPPSFGPNSNNSEPAQGATQWPQ